MVVKAGSAALHEADRPGRRPSRSWPNGSMFTEGPTWMPDGSLHFSDMPADKRRPRRALPQRAQHRLRERVRGVGGRGRDARRAGGSSRGRPFAPGATGNIATKDLVYLLERKGNATGVESTSTRSRRSHAGHTTTTGRRSTASCIGGAFPRRAAHVAGGLTAVGGRAGHVQAPQDPGCAGAHRPAHRDRLSEDGLERRFRQAASWQLSTKLNRRV